MLSTSVASSITLEMPALVSSSRVSPTFVVTNGGSLTAVTVIEAVSTATEKALPSPLIDVSALVPATPADPSQAR